MKLVRQLKINANSKLQNIWLFGSHAKHSLHVSWAYTCMFDAGVKIYRSQFHCLGGLCVILF